MQLTVLFSYILVSVQDSGIPCDKAVYVELV